MKTTYNFIKVVSAYSPLWL